MPYRMLLSLLFYAGVLNAQPSEVLLISLKPHMAFEHYEHYKRLVLKSSEGHLAQIDGFDFQWGYSYQLKIRKRTLSPARTDGARYHYQLLSIKSQVPAPDSARFPLYLDAQRYYHQSLEANTPQSFQFIDDSTYRYLDQVDIEVPRAQRAAWQKILSGKVQAYGYFSYTRKSPNRIRLQSLAAPSTSAGTEPDAGFKPDTARVDKQRE